MILELLKPQLWWILQLTGSIFVFVALSYGRIKGFNLNSYLVYMFITAISVSWMFLKSFELSPSFFQAWFVGTVALSLCGIGGSALYFKEAVSLTNYIGALLALTGSFLLII